MMKTFCKSFEAFILPDEANNMTKAVKPQLVYESYQEEVKVAQKEIPKQEELKET